MASISLQVEIGDLTNGDLDSYERKFGDFLLKKFTAAGLPGTIDEIQEVDRDEDEPEEMED